MPTKPAAKADKARRTAKAGKAGKTVAKSTDGNRATGSQDTGPFADQLRDLAGAARQRAVESTASALTGMTVRLTEYASKGGGPGLIRAFTGKDPELGKVLRTAVSPAGRMAKRAAAAPKQALEAVKDKLPSSGERGKTDRTKATNIVESIDVGVPVRTAYDLWTQFTDFPNFMKKVENVEQESDEKLTWKARVFWSHRTWESTIIDQVPDKHIVWRSKGEKGHVDGTVTFHELAPELTRILLSMEYYPQGLFERTGNLWRAQGRRVRLELKHFRRHVMAETLLKADDQPGWRGEIHDGKAAPKRRKAKPADDAEDEPAEQPAPRRRRQRQR